MNDMRHGLATLLVIAVTTAALLPLAGVAGVDEASPQYRDAAARHIARGTLPFAVSEALQIRKLCVEGPQMVALVHDSIVHFDLRQASPSAAYAELLPFRIVDVACGDPEHMHILALSWPEGRLYSIANKPDAPWPGWRRSDALPLLKDETPLGYVEGDDELRVLTTHRLLTLKGDKVAKATTLSARLEPTVLARVAIRRAGSDIYFGNDGGEWGGTLYRIDEASGTVSLVDVGAPVVSVIADADHPACVLVARAVAHFGVQDGGLLRACHATTQILVEHEPVWGVAGTRPVFVAFSRDIGELKGDSVVDRHAFPSGDTTAAGLRYARLPDAMLVTTGISQSVSLSGLTPMLVTWDGQAKTAPASAQSPPGAQVK